MLQGLGHPARKSPERQVEAKAGQGIRHSGINRIIKSYVISG